jgi:hypothetical protein
MSIRAQQFLTLHVPDLYARGKQLGNIGFLIDDNYQEKASTILVGPSDIAELTHFARVLKPQYIED